MYKIAILIPVYYNIFSETEKCSLKQCFKVLAQYPVFFIIPYGLKVENDLVCEKAEYIRVPEQWMDSIDSYNRMMCSIEFYKKFTAFDYVLIYQLDAFVFQDRLQEFCEAGYDYYGAPWLSGFRYGQRKIYVGNGGLSLRCTQAAIRLLETERYEDGNEDIFFAGYNTSFFKVAPIDIALKFAFETEVRKCYLINKKQLPFGCHAWERWDYCFWKPFIEQEGYSLKSIKGTCESAFKQWICWDLPEAALQGCIDMKYIAGKEIFIWGTRGEGFECGYFLQKIGAAEFGYIDNDCRSWGDRLWGKIIISPAGFAEQGKECVVIIASKVHEKEISEQLKQYDTDILYYSMIVKNIEAYIQQNFLRWRE